MSNVIAITGQYSNILEQLLPGKVTSSDASSFFPLTNLVGANALEPYRPFRHASPPGADRNVTFDLDLVGFGDMETDDAGNVAGFTEANTGTGDVTQTTVGGEFNGGAAGMKLASGTGTASAYVDVYMPAGWEFTVSVYFKGGGGSQTARLRVQNMETGKFLDSAGAWQSAVTDLSTQTTAAWTLQGPFTATTEAYSGLVPGGLYTLRVTIICTDSSSTVFADDLYLHPSVDTFAVIGHGIHPVISAVELRRDTAGFGGAGTLEATLTPYFPTFYHLLATKRQDRYWRLKTTGTNPIWAPLWYGSLFLGQKLVLARGMDFGMQLTHLREQVRQRSSGGAEKVYLKEDSPRREMRFGWRYTTDAQFQQARDRLYRQSGAGEQPLLMLVDDDPESAIYGRLSEDFSVSHPEGVDIRDAAELTLAEFSYPTFVG